MIGLVISMILVVGALVLFQNTAKRTAEARLDVSGDAQRTSSFLSAGLTLQDAGFGIDTPALNEHLFLLQGATISAISNTDPPLITLNGTATSGTGNAIVWAEQIITGTTRCSALVTILNNTTRRNEVYKLGPVNCPTPSLWSNLQWPPHLISEIEIPENHPATSIAIQLSTVNCQPFGITTDPGKYRVTLSARNSNGIELSTSQCLLNFPV